MKTLGHASLKEIVRSIIKDDARIDAVVGNLMISLLTSSYGKDKKSIILNDKEGFSELTERIRIGSIISKVEAGAILYAVIGWIICQKEREVELRDVFGHMVGVFKIENRNIEFIFLK